MCGSHGSESIIVSEMEVKIVAVEHVETLQLSLFRCVMDWSRSKVISLKSCGQHVMQEPLQYVDMSCSHLK